jgi:hypothetical protein
MKNTVIKSTILASSLFFSNAIFANNETQYSDQLKHWSIGIGSYAFVIANDNDYDDDYYDDGDYVFSGLSLSAAYAFNNHFQIRGTYFSLEEDDLNNLESKGYDLMAYGGVGFAKKGFRGYGGAGLFSDEWSIKNAGYSSEVSFSGFQVGGGLGYNWGPVALDFVLTLRKADEYEDEFTQSGTYIAMSGNLSVSYLF